MAESAPATYAYAAHDGVQTDSTREDATAQFTVVPGPAGRVPAQ